MILIEIRVRRIRGDNDWRDLAYSEVVYSQGWLTQGCAITTDKLGTARTMWRMRV